MGKRGKVLSRQWLPEVCNQNAPHDWAALEKLVTQLEANSFLATFIAAVLCGNLKVVLPYEERDRNGVVKGKATGQTAELVLVQQLSAARSVKLFSITPFTTVIERYKREAQRHKMIHFVYSEDFTTAEALLKTALPLLLPEAEKQSLNNYVKRQEHHVFEGSYRLQRPVSAFEVLVHMLEHRRTAISNAHTVRDFEAIHSQPVKPRSADVCHILQQVRVDSDSLIKRAP